MLREYIEEKGVGRDDWNGRGVHVIGICIVFVGMFIVDRLGLEAILMRAKEGRLGFLFIFFNF